MKKLIFLIAICGALALAMVIGMKIGGVKMAAEVQSIFTGAQEAYLQKRFDAAYQHEPIAIAIWEGTNLISFLERDAQPSATFSPEVRANQVFLSARVSALFEEMGVKDKAQEYADKALEWYRPMSSDQTITASEVVKQALARDRIRRK